MILHPAPFFGRGLAASGPAFLEASFADSIVITDELPVDDTVPLITEGVEILSLTVTPQNSSSKFLVEAIVFADANSSSAAWGAALFRGSTCIDARSAERIVDDRCCNMLRLTVLDAPASGAPLTWSVRAGPSQLTSGSLSLRTNGRSSGRRFGGAAKCTLTVQEVVI